MESMQQIVGLAVVFGLLAGSVWWLRRRGLAYVPGVAPKRRNGMLQSLERLPLSPQHSLHLVRLGGRALLIAVSPAGCQVMDSSPWQEPEGGEAARS